MEQFPIMLKLEIDFMANAGTIFEERTSGNDTEIWEYLATVFSLHL